MTEKEKVEVQREAFCVGARWAFDAFHNWPGLEAAPAAAAKHYPDPVRPREVRAEDGFWYRVVDGKVERKGLRWATTGIPEQTFRVIADLLANPTEPVED